MMHFVKIVLHWSNRAYKDTSLLQPELTNLLGISWIEGGIIPTLLLLKTRKCSRESNSIHFWNYLYRTKKNIHLEKKLHHVASYPNGADYRCRLDKFWHIVMKKNKKQTCNKSEGRLTESQLNSCHLHGQYFVHKRAVQVIKKKSCRNRLQGKVSFQYCWPLFYKKVTEVTVTWARVGSTLGLGRE